MFVFAVEKIKEQWKKYLILCLLAVCVAAAAAVALHINGAKMPQSATCDELGEYSLIAETQQQEIEFLSRFDLQVQETSLVSDRVVIPSEFNDAYNEYNGLQKEIGLDLEGYKGVTAQRDVFKLENYESDGREYYVTLLIFSGRVIGGHIGTKIYGERYRPLA